MQRGQNQLILVVDDERAFRLLTQQVLKAYGYQTVEAPGGEEAVAIYIQRRGEIAAVLTDILMPGMDGIETIRALKAIEPGLPIIAASGHMMQAQAAEIFALGVKHFLTKPFGAAPLLDALDELLQDGARSSKERRFPTADRPQPPQAPTVDERESIENVAPAAIVWFGGWKPPLPGATPGSGVANDSTRHHRERLALAGRFAMLGRT